jgi:RIO-like serine/threonine protein kinase
MFASRNGLAHRPLSKIAEWERQPLKEAITSFIQELHSYNDGYVHGNLRDTNFVVKDNKHFVLLDFDWARPIQKTSDPMHVNGTDIRRPDGAWDGEKIAVEHDLEMLNYLFHPG